MPDLLFTSAGPFISSNGRIRRFIDSTWTKTKNWKQSKKLDANQENTNGLSSSKQTVITVLKRPFFLSDFLCFCLSRIKFFFKIALNFHFFLLINFWYMKSFFLKSSSWFAPWSTVTRLCNRRILIGQVAKLSARCHLWLKNDQIATCAPAFGKKKNGVLFLAGPK